MQNVMNYMKKWIIGIGGSKVEILEYRGKGNMLFLLKSLTNSIVIGKK